MAGMMQKQESWVLLKNSDDDIALLAFVHSVRHRCGHTSVIYYIYVGSIVSASSLYVGGNRRIIFAHIFSHIHCLRLYACISEHFCVLP
jgi:hypothetical protein